MERLPPLRLLTTFAEVARAGSMQEAAGRLNVTRPAVTQALRALEEEVGVTLMDRSRKPARLTDAGQVLAQAVEAGLGMIATSIEQIRAQAVAEEGQLTLSCTLGMATYWLMPRLPLFYAKHPEVTVNVQAPPSDLPNLRPGIDVALRYGRGGWQDGETQPLFAEEVCPVGHPDVVGYWEAQMGAPGDIPTDLPLIHVTSAEAAHWANWAEYLQHKGQPMPRGRTQHFDNYVQAVQAMLDGRGLMLGWKSITGALESEGIVRRWPGGALDLGTGYFQTVAPGSEERLAVTAFTEWLRTAARR